MSDRKISQLVSLSPVGTSDLVPVVDSISGETRHVTVDDLRNTGIVSVSEEVPTDSGDHVNFTIANTPTTGSFRLFRGGARQQSGGDYTLTGTSLVLTSALATGEILLADYSH
jgi:hypothetical protein